VIDARGTIAYKHVSTTGLTYRKTDEIAAALRALPAYPPEPAPKPRAPRKPRTPKKTAQGT
jgi:hypothetical protein